MCISSTVTASLSRWSMILTKSNPRDLVEAVIRKSKGSPAAKSEAIYYILSDHSDNIIDLFKIAAFQFGHVKSSNEVELPLAGGLNSYKNFIERFGDFIDSYIESLINANVSEDEFYGEIWEFVNSSTFKTDVDKVHAFGWVLLDKRIPYYHLPPGLKMSSVDFEKVCLQIDSTIRKVTFVAHRQFKQLSERADSILSVLSELEKRDERAVLMAYLLQIIEENARDNNDK